MTAQKLYCPRIFMRKMRLSPRLLLALSLVVLTLISSYSPLTAMEKDLKVSTQYIVSEALLQCLCQLHVFCLRFHYASNKASSNAASIARVQSF